MLWLVGVLFALALVVLAPACWRAGRGLVPRWRRLLVAGALAGAATVPASPTMVLGVSVLPGVAETVVVRENGGEEPDHDGAQRVVVAPTGSPDLVIVLLLWVALINTAVQSLRLPHRLGHFQQLPPVSDPAIVARTTELAARLGLRAPVVVEPATVGGAMQMQAFAGGLLAPVVVISDGIVHRLRPAERDAILAHELAHVRHRSVLRHLVALVLASVGAVLLSGFVPFYLAALCWLGARGLLRTLIGHRDEIRADLAAARCVGFSDVAAALDKTHAAALQTEPSPWFHAVLSHPALAVRAFHLARVAPAEDRARIAVDPVLARRCMRARRFGLAVWISLLVVEIAAGLHGDWGAATALGLALLMVPLLPYLAFLRELRDGLQLHGWTAARHLLRRVLRFLAIIATVVGAIELLPWMPKDSPLVWLPASMAFVILLMFALVGRRARRAHRDLKLRLLRRDLAGYLEHFDRLKPRWRRQPEYLLQSLLVRAALGERRAAVEELQRLVGQRPRFRVAKHWAVILMSRIDPLRAVVLARELFADVPGNAVAEGTLANALRRAGEFDESWQRIQSVLRRRPRHGGWHAAAALIALARGDRAAAAASMEKAERLDPSGTVTVLARAELDVSARAASAAASVRRLREISDRLPLAFLADDATRLEHELAALSSTGI